jgi:hypothetical protein
MVLHSLHRSWPVDRVDRDRVAGLSAPKKGQSPRWRHTVDLDRPRAKVPLEPLALNIVGRRIVI